MSMDRLDEIKQRFQTADRTPDKARWVADAAMILKMMDDAPEFLSSAAGEFWVNGMMTLPRRTLFEYFASVDENLLQDYTRESLFSHRPVLGDFLTPLVDRFIRDGAAAELDSLLPGAPPALRGQVQTTLAARDAAQGNITRMDTLQEDLRNQAERETLTRLPSTDPGRFLTFALTGARTFTTADAPVLGTAWSAFACHPGYEAALDRLLAAAPSLARDALLKESATSLLATPAAGRETLASAISDYWLRTAAEKDIAAREGEANHVR
jgi:hypothetical protein